MLCVGSGNYQRKLCKSFTKNLKERGHKWNKNVQVQSIIHVAACIEQLANAASRNHSMVHVHVQSI